MKILYYDCFAGISGDMNLAAMINLGVDAEYLKAELSKLNLDDEFELCTSADARKGICGTLVDVKLKNQHHEHDHDDHYGHHHHGDHHHEHEHEHHHHHHAANRNLADIEKIIDCSTLDENVKETSKKIFMRVAEAEAKVHGKDINEVHFHEVGATDSIVDIVGAAICFHKLGVDAVWASPVELGGGFVKCAHGLIPVPAPATVEILNGIPTTRGRVEVETATPTGAAIVAELAHKFTRETSMTVLKTAYGIGHRDTEIPNVLRVHLAEVDGYTESSAVLLQCNIDDMTAEVLGAVMDRLMDEGAMDVHFTPIVMKKNRLATCLSLLCSADDEGKYRDLIFRHTTTLGIKSIYVGKAYLKTVFEKLETPYGAVTMKNAIMNGEVIRSKPELEDCRRIADSAGIPITEVYREIGKLSK